MLRDFILLQMLSTLSAGLFAGAAVYINLVEHPARMECGAGLAVTQFAPSYRRAAILQGALATIGFLSAAAAWLRGSSFWWLIGGIVLVLVIPFTLVVVFPTNKHLLDPSLDRNSELTSKLLLRWGRLHAVRSVLGLISFLIFIFLLERNALR
ncbi:MAG: DUF1772 domain-containing protein [Ignavibacteriales bacterium]